MFHELLSRDREDGCATGQPQGVGPEVYLNGTSQGATPEDAREGGHIRGRSRRIHETSGLVDSTSTGSTMHVILSDSEESSGWSRLLRFFVACRLLRMTVNGESLNLDPIYIAIGDIVLSPLI
jgi:hypothetical protein